jgi:hypothetical protein
VKSKGQGRCETSRLSAQSLQSKYYWKWRDMNTTSAEWLTKSMKRHESLSLRKAEAAALLECLALFSKSNVDDFRQFKISVWPSANWAGPHKEYGRNGRKWSETRQASCAPWYQ